MAKEKLQNSLNIKVVVFWVFILIITVMFAVLFGMRIHDTRIFDSYEDIEKADLNLVYDITSGEGTYYVYLYSAKESSDGKLVDTNRTDIVKANEVLPTVFNYFNYVRRNERANADNASFYKIYGYNVKSENDSNLKSLDLKLTDLPALVLVDGDANDILEEPLTSVSAIQKELQPLMK